jgi:hypothetical protein
LLYACRKEIDMMRRVETIEDNKVWLLLLVHAPTRWLRRAARRGKWYNRISGSNAMD